MSLFWMYYLCLIIITGNIYLSEGQIDVAESGIYTVIGHETIFPNSTYTIWVSGNPDRLDSPPPPLFITVECLRPRPANPSTNATDIYDSLFIGSYRLKPSESAIGKIQTASTLVKKNYVSCHLKVAHADTFQELQSTELKLTEGSGKEETQIYFQMDKSAYKPGDTLRVRIVLLDKNSIPDPNVPFKVTLQNPHGIGMNQWTNVHGLNTQSQNKFTVDPNGLITIEFPLATELNLGEWKLIVDTKTNQAQKPFRVEKYTLPKFYIEFSLDGNSYLTRRSTSVRAIISASYTYGKKMAGTLSVSFFNVYFPKTKLTTSAILTNGQAYVDFDPRRLGRPLIQGMAFKLEANVTEANTGRVQMGTRIVRVLEEDPYKITWLNPQNTYKPNIPFEIKIAVTDYDNRPVTQASATDGLTIHGKTIDLVQEIPPNGIVTFTVNGTTDIQEFIVWRYMTLSVQYKSKYILIQPMEYSGDDGDKFIFDIKPIPQDSLYGDSLNYFEREKSVTLLLTTSTNIDLSEVKLNYALCSETEIVEFKSGQSVFIDPNNVINTNNATLTINLPIDKAYSELKMIVYFVYGDKGTIISATTIIPTNNQLHMGLSEDTAQ